MRGSRMSRRTRPPSSGTCTMHESASLPSTRLMVRRMTVVGSRLELNRRVTSERSDRRSRPASAARRASRSCSKTWARSSAWAVRPASVDRKRRSGSPGSVWPANAKDRTPSGPPLPISGSLTTVTGWLSSRNTRGTTSAASSPCSDPSPVSAPVVGAHRRHDSEAAREARARTAGVHGHHPARAAPGARCWPGTTGRARPPQGHARQRTARPAPAGHRRSPRGPRRRVSSRRRAPS